jgi:nicotinamide phosphoribosyltransferase
MITYNQHNKCPKHFGDYTDAELSAMSPQKLIKLIKEFQKSDNLIIMTDSYKMTHHVALPDKLEESYAYLEARGGEMPYTVLTMLQYYIKKYLAGVRITPEKIEEARRKNIAHFGFDCFNADMWYYIWEKHGGVLPIEIKAVPEGTPVAIKNVLVTIKNTDLEPDKCAALVNITETLILKLWASNTVATYARLVRTLVKKYHKLTSDAPEFLIDFMHHDFGYRGVSSEETARILGTAALSTGFVGTDTMGALVLAEDYYNEPMAGFSVIATEHSVVCSYGPREKEPVAYSTIIEKVKKLCADVKPASGVIILSLVSDTYNIYNVCKRILPALKAEFIGWTNNHGIPIKIVVRPDSGDPATVLFGYGEAECRKKMDTSKLPASELLTRAGWAYSVEEQKTVETINRIASDMNISNEEAAELVDKGIMQILMEEFVFTINSKGYKVLNPQIGVLQGDGVNYKMMQSMYKIMIRQKLDIMNLVFGSGGKYLQAHDRDEQGYATKVIHVIINGEGICVQKNPITDAAKKSKKGYLKLVRTGPTWKDFVTLQSGDAGFDEAEDYLIVVFLNGELMVEYDLADLRKNSDILPEEIEFTESELEELGRLLVEEV